MSLANSGLPVHFVDALGIHTAVTTAGARQDRPIVLLHGMSSNADVYRETLQGLADNFWLIAPDLPGFGQSDETEPYTLAHLVEWLASLRAELDLPPMRLVGHSFGGALAVSYAHAYPEDVDSLLLVAPAVLVSNHYPEALKRVGIELGLVDLGTSLSHTPALLDQQIRRPFYRPERLPDTLWPRRLLAYEQSRASAEVVKALAFHDLRPLLPQLSMPVCVVWGEQDPVLSISDADLLAELIPEWPILRLPQCGHVPMLELPERFQAVVAACFTGANPAIALAQVPQFAGAPVISVFGSSAPRPGSAPYEEARLIGRLLAEKGLAVATGGYSGTMSAVSQGAAEAGGHVIGITCDQIEQFRPLGANRWVQQEIRYDTLRERLLHLVADNSGIIGLPGGIGTLSEVTLAWSFLQVGEMTPRPLALLGHLWRDTLRAFRQPEYVTDQHLDLLYFAETPELAVAYVTAQIAALS